MPRYEIYNEDGTTERETCPRCGDSVLAEHDDRKHCGRCGYTEWL